MAVSECKQPVIELVNLGWASSSLLPKLFRTYAIGRNLSEPIKVIAPKFSVDSQSLENNPKLLMVKEWSARRRLSGDQLWGVIMEVRDSILFWWQVLNQENFRIRPEFLHTNLFYMAESKWAGLFGRIPVSGENSAKRARYKLSSCCCLTRPRPVPFEFVSDQKLKKLAPINLLVWNPSKK